jgi:hypothetical protein
VPAPAATHGALPGWLQRSVSHRWWLISFGTLIYLPVGYPTNGRDFSFFRDGARVLLGLPTMGLVGSQGHLGIYAADPSTQIGPFALVVTSPVAWLGRSQGRIVMSVLMALALVLLMWLSERAGRVLTTRSESDLQLVTLLAGVCAIPMWHEVVLFAHVDDVLVMVCAAWAIDSVARGRVIGLGLALGLAVDAKPWALAFVPLLLALPSRDRIRATLTCLTVVFVAWLPFLVPHGALGALVGFHIPVAAQSPLTLLGIAPGAPMPSWARPAQLCFGLLMATVAVRRGRPAAVPLVVIAVRVALDAGAYNYYFTGLVIGCAVLEVAGTNRRLPVLTGLVTFAAFDVRWLLNSNVELAWLNGSALLLVLVGLAVRPPTPRRSDEETPGATGLTRSRSTQQEPADT